MPQSVGPIPKHIFSQWVHEELKAYEDDRKVMDALKRSQQHGKVIDTETGEEIQVTERRK